MAGLNEIMEGVGFAIANNYVIFGGNTNSVSESMPDTIISDWFIQGGIGALFGLWVQWYFNSPRMWTGWNTDRGRWMRWLGFWILLVIPQSQFQKDTMPPNGTAPMGYMITVLGSAIVWVFLVRYEPGREYSWKGRTEKERYDFWVGFGAIYWSYFFITQWDFLYSSAVQTWFLTLMWIIVMGSWAWVFGRGEEMLRLWNWMGRYDDRLEEYRHKEGKDPKEIIMQSIPL